MTGIEAGHDEDDRAIRELEREYDAAWNRSDVAHLASLYCRDAIVVNPLGEVARGQPAILGALRLLLHLLLLWRSAMFVAIPPDSHGAEGPSPFDAAFRRWRLVHRIASFGLGLLALVHAVSSIRIFDQWSPDAVCFWAPVSVCCCWPVSMSRI